VAPPRNPDPDKVPPGRSAPPASGGGFSYTPPPKKGAGPPSSDKRASELFKQFPQWRKHWGNIRNAAYRYKVDPIELLSLLLFENPRQVMTKNSSGALGLAQIVDANVRRDLNPAQYDTFIQEWANGDSRITDDMKRNNAFAIAYAAWRMGGSRGKYGSLDEWYRSPGYNPGFKGDSRGPGPSIYSGKYQASVPQTPTQTAAGSLDVAGQKDELSAVWAVRTKDGAVKFVKAPAPPKNTITWQGSPVDRAGFLKAKQYYGDIYQGYVGKAAPDAAIAHILNSGLSDTGLMTRLSKSPNFKNGTIYKGRAGGLILRAQQLYGTNWKPDADLVRRAIVESWDEGTFVANLRKRPEYLKGPEFKKDEAGLLNVHMSIMGTPDDKARVGIREAVLGGWSSDQYAAYLRGSDAYKYSPEAQTKALSFAEAMGLITGQVPTLQPGKSQIPTQPKLGVALPNSGRIPGKGELTPSNNLAVNGGY
jgi:hypothetical protein